MILGSVENVECGTGRYFHLISKMLLEQIVRIFTHFLQRLLYFVLHESFFHFLDVSDGVLVDPIMLCVGMSCNGDH